MNQTVYKHVKTFFRKFGLELKRYDMYSSESLQLQRLLQYKKIETVIDVGANIGQFAINLRLSGYRGKIISFEPTSDAHKMLRQNANNDPNWIVADRMAIGDRNGEVEINVSANSVASSVLTVLDSHGEIDPGSKIIRKELVPIKKLDSILEKFDLKDKIFLKIDVEGFECEVMSGATDIIKRTKGLQLEMSFIPRYNNQQLSLIAYVESLKKMGFELYSIHPTFIDESSGRLLVVDGVFFRNDL